MLLIEPGEIILWWQHPITKALLYLIGTTIGFVAAGIIAIVRFVHPHVKHSVIAEAVAEAQKPMVEHIEEQAAETTKHEVHFARLYDANDVIRNDVGEIKQNIERVRVDQSTQASILARVDGRLHQVILYMNGGKRLTIPVDAQTATEDTKED
jgi:hypothetical protein